MTAKQTWIVEMPEKWLGPGHCFFCRLEHMGPKNCAEIKCPIANAKKAVEVKPGGITLFPCPGATSVYLDPEGVPVTLYATEENTK